MSASLKIPVSRIAISSLTAAKRSFSFSRRPFLFRFSLTQTRVYRGQKQQRKFHRLCSTAGDGECQATDVSNSQKHSTDSEGKVLQKLRRYGVAGVLSYGLLNTVYYLTTFILVWFYVAPAPGRMGYVAAVERFLKVMAMVWAGSQVTKRVRAGGALALTPFVDRGLS